LDACTWLIVVGAERRVVSRAYRGTSLSRKRTPLGPYRRPMPRVLGGFWGGECFLMGEVPLLLGCVHLVDGHGS